MSIGWYISLGIMIFFAATVLFGVIFGLKRGFFKTLVRIITIVAAAVLTILLIFWIFQYIGDWFAGKTLPDAIRAVWSNYDTSVDEKTRQLIASFDAQTAERIIMMAFSLFAVPVIFIASFYILKVLFLIVYLILVAILGFGGRKKRSVLGTLLGGLAGAVQGALIAAVVLMPVAGFCGMAADMKESLTSSDKPQETVDTVEGFYRDYLDELIESPTISAIRTFGGDYVFGEIAKVTVAGEEVDMRRQAKSVVEIYVDGIPLAGMEWTALSEYNKGAFVAILEDVDNDDYTAATVAGLLRGISKAIKSGTYEISVEEPFDSFMYDFLSVFETSDADNLTGDLGTFLNVYFILSDSGVLAVYATPSDGSGALGDVKDLLIAKDGSGKMVIQNISDELELNPRTKHISVSLAKLSLKLIAEAVDNALPPDVDADAVYSNVKNGITNILADVNDDSVTAEEKKENVKASLSATLIDSGVTTESKPIDDDIMDSVAEYIIENFSGKEELTDTDINNTILSYYDAYAKQQASAGT